MVEVEDERAGKGSENERSKNRCPREERRDRRIQGTG
jgi:hypothetical protein